MECNKVLKGLEICGKGEPCGTCPYFERHRNKGRKDEIACTDALFLDAREEMKRLKAENEQLKIEQTYEENLAEIVEQRGVKEFAERLKKGAYHCGERCGINTYLITDDLIENILKQMGVEDK